MTRELRHIFAQRDIDAATESGQERILADCGELVTFEKQTEGDVRPICGPCANLMLAEVRRAVEVESDMIDRLMELEDIVTRARRILYREGPARIVEETP